MTNSKAQANQYASIVIKCEFITAPLIRCNANKTMELKSVDGSHSVTINAGETFYLAKAESLGDGFYYVLNFDIHAKSGLRCYCPSYALRGYGTCKHAGRAQAHHADYCRNHKAPKQVTTPVALAPLAPASTGLQALKPAHAASIPAVSKLPIVKPVTRPLPAAPVARQSTAVRGNLNGQRAFSLYR